MAVLGSIIFKTASTAIGEKCYELDETTLEARAVETQVINESRSESSTGREILLRISRLLFSASPNPSLMVVGWIPFSNKPSQASKKAPAITTTLVVPSPASIS